MPIGRSVLAMDSTLGMRVTADGVETLELAQALPILAGGCLQGVYFSHPVVALEVPSLPRRHCPSDSEVKESIGDRQDSARQARAHPRPQCVAVTNCVENHLLIDLSPPARLSIVRQLRKQRVP
jgi:hypothetical protein